ncbi:tetratricopeptide repeat protein [Streptomyces sp. NPDC059743]|uniref:tetratricopeptide repeat protein n=1 Tax=Streptomyces sp. NPDC059743 TaxID=3346928 RepID=UPI003648C40E
MVRSRRHPPCPSGISGHTARCARGDQAPRRVQHDHRRKRCPVSAPASPGRCAHTRPGRSASSVGQHHDRPRPGYRAAERCHAGGLTGARHLACLGHPAPAHRRPCSVRPLASDTRVTATVLNGTGLFRGFKGQRRRAIPLLERALATGERLLGTDDPYTITFLNNVAYAYQEIGDLDRSIPLHEQAVDDAARVWGAGDPLTLTARSNLAQAYKAAGDLNRALPLFLETAEEALELLGRDHPVTRVVGANMIQLLKNWPPDDPHPLKMPGSGKSIENDG